MVRINIFKATNTIQRRLPIFTLHWNRNVLAVIAATLAEISIVENKRMKAVLGKAVSHFIKAAVGRAAQAMGKDNRARAAFPVRHI